MTDDEGQQKQNYTKISLCLWHLQSLENKRTQNKNLNWKEIEIKSYEIH